ncbi:aspartate aminotransferase [candidate division LCP-89 bacterium B3_LCP]|uniref:Aminotransferase n=1 Tax=candidate division LCP-89 bacterium B3_LCP TaxID=2012998 RepID=A0A532UZL1_UNCL8|nr:MAG: aspartate aminotransferase [candidate division LCP-89 bacterium B3_LCP]
MKLASRMSRLGTETAFEVLAKAKALEAQGRHMIHLEIGEPDFDTPRHICEAAIKALNAGETHYNPSAGIPPLREAIAQDISSRRGIDAKAEEVVVTPGAKPIMFFSILALAEKGDEVIYPNPGFPIYESVINWVGAKSVPLPLREELEFRFDIEDLKRLVNDRTKLIIVNSPQNPTGGVLTMEDLEQIAELAIKHDCYVLTDEVYCNIIYDGEHKSISTLPGMRERTIILDGFSKTYAMTGWRAGYGVMPVALADQVARLQTNSNSCVNTFVQYACIEAIKGPQDEVAKMDAEFKRRRDVIVDGLNEIPGFKCLKPRGAFYVFPNIQELPLGSRELEQYLLEEAGVAALSGTSFGKYGDGYVRFSYANSIENIKIALERIREAVVKL